VLEAGPRGLRPGGPQGRATLNLVASVGLVDEVRAGMCVRLCVRWCGWVCVCAMQV
jgi:hypothetical protein